MKRAQVEVVKQSQKVSRLGLLSILSIMVLGLTQGLSLRAEEAAKPEPTEFKLWRTVADKEGKFAEVKFFEEGKKEEASKLLTAQAFKAEDFMKVVKENPLQFAEAVRHALSSKEEKDRAALLKTITEALKKLDAEDHFGSEAKKLAYLELLKAVSKLSNDDLKSDKWKDVMKQVFLEGKGFMAVLEITTKNLNKKEEKDNDELKRQKEKLAELEKKLAAQKQPEPVAPDYGPLMKQFEALCAGLKDALKGVKDALALKDANGNDNNGGLLDAFRQLAGNLLNKPQQVALADQENPNKDLEDLVKKAGGEQQQNPFAQQQQQFPQTAANDRRRRNNENILPQNIPQQQQQPQTGSVTPPTVASRAPISVDRPTNTSATVLGTAQSAKASAETALKEIKPVTTDALGRPLPPAAQAQSINSAKDAIANVKMSLDKQVVAIGAEMTRLRTQLKEKGGVDERVDEASRSRETSLKQEIATAQFELSQAREQGLSTSAAEMKLKGAQDNLEDFNQEKARQKSSVKRDFSGIEESLAQLETEKGQIETTINRLSTKENELTGSLAQLAAANSPQGPGVRSNVNGGRVGQIQGMPQAPAPRTSPFARDAKKAPYERGSLGAN